MAGCRWTVDGIPKWKQDLWNCSAIPWHRGDLFDITFSDAEGQAAHQRATEERRAGRQKKVVPKPQRGNLETAEAGRASGQHAARGSEGRSRMLRSGPRRRHAGSLWNWMSI
ncbi:uncharacterized protein WM294_013170 isoform 2-T4 [Sarcoramphus papa]